MASLPADYDSDPDRWQSWEAPRDVHQMVGPELGGPVLDVGCGEGRLATVLAPDVEWFGVDSSPAQIAANPHRPLICGEMTSLPFRDQSFAEVAHLWCLYHVDEPVAAIREAQRVLKAGGRYYACCSSRDNDPEIMAEGYPSSTFDAEEAITIVSTVFDNAVGQTWGSKFFPLETRDAIRAYCRHHFIPPERAEAADVPLWLTKRGILVRATKH